jgi:hypothetical protein
MIDIIKRHYYSCPNVVNEICSIEWKHDVCKTLREILLEITKDQIYDPWKLDTKEISELQKTINKMMDENKDYEY